MREYEVYEAKTKLPESIKEVHQGERITITNRGKPVAYLVASAGWFARQAAEAIASIRAMRSGTIDQAQFVAMRLSGRLLASCTQKG